MLLIFYLLTAAVPHPVIAGDPPPDNSLAPQAATVEIWQQEDIARSAPDNSAPFIPILKPVGGAPRVEILAQLAGWEKVRLHYRFIFNASSGPNTYKMSLYEATFTGFRQLP